MILFRPIKSADLDQVVQLASITGFGLSTLPADRTYLEERIQQSQRSFDADVKKPKGETYLFVLEDTKENKLVGTSGVVAKVGGFEPFYAYQITTRHLQSEALNVDKEIEILNLVEEHNGPSEIGSLFLNPTYQGRGLGRLLSYARFLFMAEYPGRFEADVIAEMRGVVDATGHSPFWDALGRHFFDIDFPKADYLSMKNKSFIAELMPRHPVYIPLLPPDAREVIGAVHDKTAPALRLLEQQGFKRNGMVDIFEAGPIVSCARDEIATIRSSQCEKIIEIAEEVTKDHAVMFGTTSLAFRACCGYLEKLDDGIRMDQCTASALEVERGDTIRYSALTT